MPSQNYTQQLGLGQGQLWAQRLAGGSGLTAPTATPGNIQGAQPQGGQGPYGANPQVPSLGASQGTAISSNMGNLSNLYNLGTSLNTNIAQQAALPYQLNLPNYGAMTGASSQNILSLLRGQVPQDVANQIAQMGAERGVATGSIGSPNSEAALLRSLGLTSLGLQGQGEQELTGAVARTPTGQQFNPQSFLTTPQQQQEAQYAANVLASAPDPTAAANAQLATSLFGMQLGRQQVPQGNPLMPMPVGAAGGYGQALPPAMLPIGGGLPSGFGNQYSEPIGPPNTFQPGDFEAMGFGDDQTYGGSGVPPDWQTGMNLENYSPPDLFSGDLFGG